MLRRPGAQLGVPQPPGRAGEDPETRGVEVGLAVGALSARDIRRAGDSGETTGSQPKWSGRARRAPGCGGRRGWAWVAQLEGTLGKSRSPVSLWEGDRAQDSEILF